MITTKERAFLRAKSNDLPDLVFVGKEGVTENVINQVKTNLFAHELIKIKVQRTSDQTSRELADEIATRSESEIISVVGSKIVLYRYTEKEGFRHYL